MENRPVTSEVKDGNLYVGGANTLDLADQFGSPLWVLDQATIEHYCTTYMAAFKKHIDNVLPLFASKALCTVATSQLIDKLGFGFDVVSGGELYTVLKAGVAPEKIYFHGNNKSYQELEFAIENNVGRIVVDNLYELERIDKIAKEKDTVVNILFRITPEVDAHTHEFIQTGQLDSKFGVPRSLVMDALKVAVEMDTVNVLGVHAHIGSQIFDALPFKAATEKLCDIALEARNKLSLTFQEINVGGGLGIKYMNDDDPADIEEFADVIGKTLAEFCQANNFPVPKLILEPGRSIVANAGVTLYKVGSMKEIPGIRTYIAVDGGMADNARPITYDAQYDAVLANKADKKTDKNYRVAGKFCESGDILIKDINLPTVEIGDTLCVFATGAYNYSMASNYNRFCKPAIVLVKDGNAKVIVKRETYEDIVRNDLAL